MLFAVLFTDKPGHGPLRAEHLQPHIRWVDEHKAQVLVAGSLRHEPGEVPQGGLWIVEAETKAAVLELMKTDPARERRGAPLEQGAREPPGAGVMPMQHRISAGVIVEGT